MAVMIVLAIAHFGFWVWAVGMGLQAGTTGPLGASLVAAWFALMGTWAAFVGQLARSGWLPGPGATSFPAIWISAPAVMVSLLALLAFPAFREAWFGSVLLLPAAAVPALNSLRILAIGSALKAWRGQLPKRIGFGVGIPDSAFGLWSMAIALRGGLNHGGEEVAWHAIGAGILLLMVPMVSTVLRPPRLDASYKGDARGILRFPLVLAPAGLALPFLILHLSVLYAVASQGVSTNPRGESGLTPALKRASFAESEVARYLV